MSEYCHCVLSEFKILCYIVLLGTELYDLANGEAIDEYFAIKKTCSC